MSFARDDSPLEDLQDFLENFKEKYDDVEVDSSFVQPAPGGRGAADEEQREPWDLEFDYTPTQIREHLDRYVIGQSEAKKQLANAVCYHYHQTRRDDPFYQKKNILMIGNTGVGKTHLVEVLSEFIGVPFVKADATKFSGTGYVGRNVNSLVRELAEKADQNLERAEHGIVFIDEIDKICSSDSMDRDVSGRDVQTNLLKLLEETDVSLVDPSNPASMMRGMQTMFQGDQEADRRINTRKILFIVSGAFPDLEGIIADRIDRGGLGFTAEVDRARDLETLRHCEPRDLMEYGLEAEFVGRLPVRTYLDDLDEEDLYRILTESESSVLRQYRRDFASYDVELEFTDDALRAIADRARDQGIGARGLTSVLETVLYDFMHELPGRSVNRLTVDRKTVEHPYRRLQEVLLDEELEDLLREEFAEHGVDVEVTAEGRDALLELSEQRQVPALTLFRERFESLHHILNMIERDDLRIDADFIHNYDEELDRLCSEYFGGDADS